MQWYLPLFIVDTGQVSMHDCIVGAQVECPQVGCYRSVTNKQKKKKTHHSQHFTGNSSSVSNLVLISTDGKTWGHSSVTNTTESKNYYNNLNYCVSHLRLFQKITLLLNTRISKVVKSTRILCFTGCFTLLVASYLIGNAAILFDKHKIIWSKLQVCSWNIFCFVPSFTVLSYDRTAAENQSVFLNHT
jgi:uncharacterized protein with PQ loop repeat